MASNRSWSLFADHDCEDCLGDAEEAVAELLWPVADADDEEANMETLFGR